ncbi:hypothetical protein Poli38472_001485 [Pythium oligandrum]|uniref:Lipoxygenase domain-containing protein n=1 Tax=Pythium oligandrum TaxID=41045 RepID=A0A8K1FQE2_PYTOL|nr:hypothetical protein Poli38472_001485 [Pythium oligandrum]|eukprot:TMW69329.1 hypothetical protein Poli38472_001485 [Pythium oligandrum]
MLRSITATMVALLALHEHHGSVQAALSIPKPSDTSGTRADAIAAIRAVIKNEPRTIMVGSQEVPSYNGPVPRPGSLAEKIQLLEAQALLGNSTTYTTTVGKTVATQVAAGKITSVDSIVSMYDLFTDLFPKPVSTDISDEAFGEERLTTKAMKLRQVRVNEYTEKPFALTDAQLSQLCGRGINWRNIRARRALYVEDLHDVAQWNDPAAPQKYVPNAVGFFCYNAITCKFVPIEIQFPDTGLAYTPFDSKNEWILAKMGLNTASVSYHQWAHFCETHAIASPIRVELFRNMAAEHPIRVLLEHHAYVDYGLELLSIVVLLSPDTPMDRVYGWGAIGAARFIHHHIHNEISLNNDLPTDLRMRGVDDIPHHKYAQYGTMLYNAISAFAKRYIATFYKSDFAVKNDFELQHWARDCALVPHLKDFPSKITSQAQLQKLVTHLLYLSGVKHHAMNGAITWAAASAPYSNGGLRKPMPTRKGEAINLMQYISPLPLLPVTIAGPAFFIRPVVKSQAWTGAYDVAPFSQEPALKTVIAEFQESLSKIDAFIHKQESGEKWPYEFLRPSTLPYYSWI